MSLEFEKKTTNKSTATAAAHQNQGKVLKDNRASNVIQQQKNNTGLPDNLKTGIESLSGHSLDDVKVHYNSSKPAQLNAHAYAQGTNIHVASGQEKHVAHEAWHVVQQKQGRVRPTKTVNGAKINDNAGLEKEADVMGTKALQLKVDNTLTERNTSFIKYSTSNVPLQLRKGKKKRAEKKAAKEAAAQDRTEARTAKKAKDAEIYEEARAGKARDSNRIRRRKAKAAMAKARADSKINARKEHILTRHSPRSDKFPEKTKFPVKWSDGKIITEIMHVVMDKTNPIKEDPKYGPHVLGMAGGIEIEVFFYKRKESDAPDAPLVISTAYPKDHSYVAPKKKSA